MNFSQIDFHLMTSRIAFDVMTKQHFDLMTKQNFDVDFQSNDFEVDFGSKDVVAFFEVESGH